MASLTLANSLKVQSSFSIAAPLLELCNPSLVLLSSFDETVVINKVELSWHLSWESNPECYLFPR